MVIKSSLLKAALVLLVISVPGFAQGIGKSCDISGTWYGGGEPQYQWVWTNAPIGAGRYSLSAQPSFDMRSFGYVTWTGMTGEATKTGAQTYEFHGMQYLFWDQDAAEAAGIDPKLPEVDIVHSRIKFVDCDTFTYTADVYAGYLSFTPEMTPFVDTPDIDWLQILTGGIPIVETYRRMPTGTTPKK